MIRVPISDLFNCIPVWVVTMDAMAASHPSFAEATRTTSGGSLTPCTNLLLSQPSAPLAFNCSGPLFDRTTSLCSLLLRVVRLCRAPLVRLERLSACRVNLNSAWHRAQFRDSAKYRRSPFPGYRHCSIPGKHGRVGAKPKLFVACLTQR